MKKTMEQNHFAEVFSKVETKPCSYPTCRNTIPVNSEFTYCEVCRTLVIRNNIALANDPTCPIMARRGEMLQIIISLMRPEEIINFLERLEWTYTEVNKISKSFAIQKYRNDQFNEAMVKVSEERELNVNPKKRHAKNNQTKFKERMIKQFGNKAKDILAGLGDPSKDEEGF